MSQSSASLESPIRISEMLSSLETASLPPRRTGFLLVDFLLAGDFDGWWAAFRQLILPALSMALFVVAPLARITRASMLVSLGSDFVRTARSMGLPRWRIIVTYALRNAILPVTISYRTAPNEKRSVRVSTSLPRTCSGDM